MPPNYRRSSACRGPVMTAARIWFWCTLTVHPHLCPADVLQLHKALPRRSGQRSCQLDKGGLLSTGRHAGGNDTLRLGTFLQPVVIDPQRLGGLVNSVPPGHLDRRSPQRIRNPSPNRPTPTPLFKPPPNVLKWGGSPASPARAHRLSSTKYRPDSQRYQTPQKDSCRLAGRTRATAEKRRQGYQVTMAGEGPIDTG
jgi:hypothetical protein